MQYQRESRAGHGSPLRVCTHLSEVLDAWELVYSKYLSAGFISPSDAGIYTYPQYVGPSSAVVIYVKDGRVRRTLSMAPDLSSGLPLDLVFRTELDELRQQGTRLFEVGLHASADDTFRLHSELDLQASAILYAEHFDYDACVVGMPISKARFYERVLGFKAVATVPTTPYDEPGVLLALYRHEVCKSRLYRRAGKLELDWSRSYRFPIAEVESSALAPFLSARELDRLPTRELDRLPACELEQLPA